MLVVHFNNGMCAGLKAKNVREVQAEAEALCNHHNCGGAVRDHSAFPRPSVQVGGVGLTTAGVYQYEAMTHV